MKKLKIKKNTAAGILAGLMLASCTPAPSQDQNVPADSGDPAYEPAENENPDVYGPAIAETEEPEAEDDYDAEENVTPAVYGPPPAVLDPQNGDNEQP